MKVLLGQHDTSLRGSMQKAITVMSEKIILHEQYKECTAKNDIGIVKLSRGVMSAQGKL